MPINVSSDQKILVTFCGIIQIKSWPKDISMRNATRTNTKNSTPISFVKSFFLPNQRSRRQLLKDLSLKRVRVNRASRERLKSCCTSTDGRVRHGSINHVTDNFTIILSARSLYTGNLRRGCFIQTDVYWRSIDIDLSFVTSSFRFT